MMEKGGFGKIINLVGWWFNHNKLNLGWKLSRIKRLGVACGIPGNSRKM
jgi:hypothetical protein